MAEIYGAGTWEREFPVGMQDRWGELLGAFTPNDLARGVEAANRSSRTVPRPPKLGAFMAMCRNYQPGTFAGNATPTEKALGPAVSHANSEIARRELAYQRQVMRGEIRRLEELERRRKADEKQGQLDV